VLAVGITLAAAITGVSGCGGDEDGTHAAATPKSVRWSAAPPPASTADPRLGATMKRLSTWSDGKRSAVATMVMTTGGRDLRFDGVFSWGEHPGMQVQAPTAQLGIQRLNSAATTQIRMVDGTYYYRVDTRPSGPLKGKHWMKAALSDLPGGTAAQPADPVLQDNPTVGLMMLADITGVTDLGTENLDGTVGTHYQGTVTRARLSGDRRFAGAAGSPGGILGGADSAQLDVWADSHGKPLRWVATMQDPKRSVAVDLYSFGGPRPVAVPAPGDTVDAAALARGRSGA
jgi:hypothetical protein